MRAIFYLCLASIISLSVTSCGSNGGDGEPTEEIATGVNVSLHGARLFPSNNPWNQEVSNEPVDENSDNLIASIGTESRLHPDWGTYYEGRQIGFNYMVVSGDQQKYPINCYYPLESDPGPYPIPLDAQIQQGGTDRHVLALDKDNWILYELFDASPTATGWNCGSGAIFDLKSNAYRPAGWTSADAAGMPILPGLVRWDEVMEQKEIKHALRFTVPLSRKAYVAPARHFASYDSNPNLPPMGMRVRLKASVDITGFSPALQVVMTALKKYGMFVTDNGRAWEIPGTFDPRWNDQELAYIKLLKGSDFEVVKMKELTLG